MEVGEDEDGCAERVGGRRRGRWTGYGYVCGGRAGGGWEGGGGGVGVGEYESDEEIAVSVFGVGG